MNKESINQRIKYLRKVIESKEKALANAPDGKLRIVRRGDHAYYYHRLEAKDTNGVYIKHENVELAAALAQKEYDLRVLKLAETEAAQLERLLTSVKIRADEYYNTLNPAWQELIDPLIQTDAQYVKQWVEASYRQKIFDEKTPAHYTLRGERMRSKSEVMIADALDRNGIPYRYECGVKIKGFGYYFPDFTALKVRERKVFIWEHFGMMDDEEYCKTALARVDTYEKNGYYPGINLIITHETKDNPLQVTTIEKIIETYLI